MERKHVGKETPLGKRTPRREEELAHREGNEKKSQKEEERTTPQEVWMTTHRGKREPWEEEMQAVVAGPPMG